MLLKNFAKIFFIIIRGTKIWHRQFIFVLWKDKGNPIMNLNNKLVQTVKDVMSLFYPNLCVVCHQTLVTGEEFLCIECELALPKSGYPLNAENPLSKKFWGRISLESSTAFMLFNKEDTVKEIIHQIKYQGKKELAEWFAKQFAASIAQEVEKMKVDAFIPVPMHKKKLRSRGFNQAALLAHAMGSELNIPVIESLLLKKTNTKSQTKKGRFDRWLNAEHQYAINFPENLEGLHIGLVDDVVTTGATMEACVQSFNEVKNLKISIFALATTSN